MKLNNTEIIQKKYSEFKKINIEKPEIQRIIDNEKIKDIVQSQLEFFKHNGFFNFTSGGPINIHVLNDKYLLLDGQHRLRAIEILYNDFSHDIEFFVQIVRINTKEELEYNYNMINKNTPLPDFSLFENIDKKIPEQVALQFMSEYPTIWSKTSRARRPHLYYNYFQESLAFICSELKVTSVSHLYSIVIDFNQVLKGWDKYSFKVTDNVYNTAKEKKLYLGLFKHQNEDYGYEWAKKIVEEKTGRTIKKSATSSKKHIPKKVKNDAWDKYIGKTVAVAPCLCCRRTEIEQKKFTAGHIISEYNGGKVTLDNIVPICDSCNLSMATKNMDEYILEYYPDNYDKFVNKDYKLQKISWFSTILPTNL